MKNLLGALFLLLVACAPTAPYQKNDVSRQIASRDKFPNSISEEEAGKLPLDQLEALYLRDRKTSHASDDLIAPRENDLLTIAEQVVIQVYTRDNEVENERIFIAGVEKLPKASGIFFRGVAQKGFRVKDIFTVSRPTGISAVRRIAESFTDPNGALLEIKAKSARDIRPYSVIEEGELILLPGTKLRVDAISEATLRFHRPNHPDEVYKVPYVRESEL